MSPPSAAPPRSPAPAPARCRGCPSAARSRRRSGGPRRPRPRRPRPPLRARRARAAATGARGDARRRARARRAVGSCSRRLTTARASASTRSRSRSDSDSQRPAFSASSRRPPRRRASAARVSVGSTSRRPSQPANDWISSSTIASARRASSRRTERFPRTCACSASMSSSVTPATAAHAGIDVARHGQIDQQQRPPVALLHHRGQLLRPDDRVRRGGRGDDDVGPHELLRQRVEGAGGATEALRQSDRPVAPAVGDEHRRHAVEVEGARDLLGVLAGAHDQHVARGEVTHQRPRGLDRHRRHRRLADRDRRSPSAPACRSPAPRGRACWSSARSCARPARARRPA